MARFSAYTTDSEDGDSGSEASDQSSVVSYDNGPQTAPSGNARVEADLQPRSYGHREEEDDDEHSEAGDTEVDSEDEQQQTRPRIRKARFSASTYSPPITQRHPAPSSIIPWAREIGVDVQKIHVMQTAFFRKPEEDAAIQTMNQPPRPKSYLSAALNRKHSRDSEGEGLRADSRQRASFAHDIDPTPYRPSRKYARVVSSASVVTGNEGVLVDAGLSLGRSFRVGWGPGGTLVHLGALCGPFGNPTTTANSSVIKHTVVPLVAGSTADATDAATRLLSHQLSNSSLGIDADGIPVAHPSPHLTFSSFQALFSCTDRSFEACLFRLGHALFDSMDLRLSGSTSVDVRNRVAAVRRKAALSEWLQKSVSSIIDATLRDNPGADWAANVFALLTGNQIEKASETAMDEGSVKLASLIAQCPGDEEFRDDLQAQLVAWREERVDVHISENTRKIYALLAGIVDVLEGSKGSGLEQCPDVDVAAKLDWKRAFGLHLWFGERMDTSITESFNSYDRLWKDHSASVSPPFPWYSEGTARKSAWKTPGSAQPPDALYSLIKLYADPACSLSTILTPFSFSPSPSDYRLPWHLYILLSRCLRVRDFADRDIIGAGDAHSEGSDDDDAHVEGHSPSADLLANSYALQLEQLGMIQEAVFVLLHIEGSAGRAKAIKDLLIRSASKLDDWMTRGLVGSLKLPMSWIHEAKAIYAFDHGEIFEAYESYLSAGLYNDAHDLAVLELAPDAVIRQDLSLLKDLFVRFEGHPVEGWHVGGKVFLDYVHVSVRLPELRDQLSSVRANSDAAVDIQTEIDRLSRSSLKMIGTIPDVLRKRGDVRHTAAIETMTAELMLQLDKTKSLAMPMPRALPATSESTRLRSFQSFAYQKFLRTIEVS